MRKHDQSSVAAEGARRATGAAAARDRKGRFSARCKRATVLRLLFLAAGPGRLEEPSDRGGGRRPPSAAGQDRRTPDGDRVAVCEGRPVGGRPPFGPPEVDAMSGAQSISTRRAYGVQRVCRVWARPRSSVYARRQAPRDCARAHRRGPVGAAPDEVLVGHIRRVLEASPFHGEGYRKVWAKLRVEGIRTSPERVRRLIRSFGVNRAEVIIIERVTGLEGVSVVATLEASPPRARSSVVASAWAVSAA